jgi:hypothetical protein
MELWVVPCFESERMFEEEEGQKFCGPKQNKAKRRVSFVQHLPLSKFIIFFLFSSSPFSLRQKKMKVRNLSVPEISRFRLQFAVLDVDEIVSGPSFSLSF